MKKLKIVILSIFFLSSVLLNAQHQILFVDSTFVEEVTYPISDLSFLATDGSICIDQFYGQSYLHYSDICIGPDSTRYGFHLNRNYDPVGSTGIFEILDPSSPPGFYGGQSLNEVIEIDTLIQGLTCVPAGFLYAAGKGITRINPSGGDVYLGDLPPNLHCQGDITVYNNTFYMVANGNKLVEVNIQNPSLSEVLWEFPSYILPIHALATMKLDCNSSITYAIGKGVDHSVLYQIDYENQILIEICDASNKLIEGAASYSECTNALCEIFVDLDFDNSSGGGGNDFLADTTCVPPIAIADDDVAIITEPGGLDSISVVLSGISDIGLEYLSSTFTNIGNTVVNGIGTNRITIVDEGVNSEMINFEFALENISYENDAFIPTNGTREITIIAYSTIFGGDPFISLPITYESEPVTSYITLNNESLEFNYSVNEPDCFGYENGSVLTSPTGGLAPYTIEWSTGEVNDSIVNLAQGIYSLTVTDTDGCRRADTIELTQPDSLIAFIESSNGNISCDSSGELSAEATGGTMPYNYLWSNESTEQTNSQLPAGNYLVTITDENGCMGFAEYQLIEDTIYVNEQVQICEGEVFEFNNESFGSDTSFCVNFVAVNGCDSIHCIDLQVIDTSYFELFEEICSGDSYSFNGAIITQEGIYADTLVAFNGCDSIIVLDLEVNPVPIASFDVEGDFCVEGEIEVTFNPDNEYIWATGSTANVLTFTEPGLYLGTATNDFNCETEIEFVVEEPSDLDVSLKIQNPLCFGDLYGSILIDTIIGGLAPYAYSLNGEPTLEDELENLIAGDYELLVEGAIGCQATMFINITDPFMLMVDAGSDQSVSAGDIVTLSVNSSFLSSSVQWLPSEGLECDTCLLTNAYPQQTTEYEVSLTDENGCIVMDSITVFIENSTAIYIPNSFSPNEDGINDIFQIYGPNINATVLSFEIFDRNGSKVYEAFDYPISNSPIGWDGTFKGEPLSIEIYMYIAKIEFEDGRTQSLVGDVMLMR